MPDLESVGGAPLAGRGEIVEEGGTSAGGPAPSTSYGIDGGGAGHSGAEGSSGAKGRRERRRGGGSARGREALSYGGEAHEFRGLLDGEPVTREGGLKARAWLCVACLALGIACVWAAAGTALYRHYSRQTLQGDGGGTLGNYSGLGGAVNDGDSTAPSLGLEHPGRYLVGLTTSAGFGDQYLRTVLYATLASQLNRTFVMSPIHSSPHYQLLDERRLDLADYVYVNRRRVVRLSRAPREVRELPLKHKDRCLTSSRLPKPVQFLTSRNTSTAVVAPASVALTYNELRKALSDPWRSREDVLCVGSTFSDADYQALQWELLEFRPQLRFHRMWEAAVSNLMGGDGEQHQYTALHWRRGDKCDRGSPGPHPVASVGNAQDAKVDLHEEGQQQKDGNGETGGVGKTSSEGMGPAAGAADKAGTSADNIDQDLRIPGANGASDLDSAAPLVIPQVAPVVKNPVVMPLVVPKVENKLTAFANHRNFHNDYRCSYRNHTVLELCKPLAPLYIATDEDDPEVLKHFKDHGCFVREDLGPRARGLSDVDAMMLDVMMLGGAKVSFTFGDSALTSLYSRLRMMHGRQRVVKVRSDVIGHYIKRAAAAAAAATTATAAI